MLLLLLDNARSTHPATAPPSPLATGPSPSTCGSVFRIGFVTDVAGLSSTADADAWRGIQRAVENRPCLHDDLVASAHPSDYQRNLQSLVDRHDDLVIAPSFLLTDATVAAAQDNPGTRFVLLDPLVPPASLPNLAVVTFRDDQAAFLAGALAGLVSTSRVVAGVYGLDSGPDRRYRNGFEHGVAYINSAVRVLGAYQSPTDETPYANPEWGAAQARAFMGQGADLIFGIGGTTGQGAISAAAQAGRACIGADGALGESPACPLTTVVRHLDQAVELVVAAAASGRYHAGLYPLGLAEQAVGLGKMSDADPDITAAIRARLQQVAAALTDGSLATGYVE